MGYTFESQHFAKLIGLHNNRDGSLAYPRGGSAESIILEDEHASDASAEAGASAEDGTGVECDRSMVFYGQGGRDEVSGAWVKSQRWIGGNKALGESFDAQRPVRLIRKRGGSTPHHGAYTYCGMSSPSLRPVLVLLVCSSLAAFVPWPLWQD